MMSNTMELYYHVSFLPITQTMTEIFTIVVLFCFCILFFFISLTHMIAYGTDVKPFYVEYLYVKETDSSQ